MSRVYDNTTFETPWNYSQNELEPRIAKEQWQNGHGVFRRDESNSPPTGIQLRETKSKSNLCDDDDDIPEWTNTFFGTTFRRYSEEWKQVKSRWQLKYGQISPSYDPTTTKESKSDSFETSGDRIVPYMTHKNGTIESIENNRSSYTEWSNQDNDTKKKKEFKRKRCICFALITVITCLVLAACITSALLIHVLDTPKNKNSYVETKISATATNQQYIEGMEDASSKVFKDFQIQFCSAAQTKLDQTSSCKVESLRNGSIVVIFIIYIKTENSEAEVKTLIMDKFLVKEDGKEQITLGIFEIKPDSFGVTETRTISEESLPKDSINRPVDKETDNTKSSSSSVVSTKDGSTPITLQSVNPTTSFASQSDSSSNQIESSTHVFLQENTITEIHTTTTEESTPSLMLESDILPSSTSSIVSSDTTSSITNSINVDSLIGPTSTAPVASTTEPESTAQTAASNTEPTDTSYMYTIDPPSNDYEYTTSLKLSTDRSSEMDSSSFEMLKTTNAAPLTSTLYMEYVSTSLLEIPSQAPVALTSEEPLITESTQLFTTEVEDELQKSSISIDPTRSIVEEMYSSDATTSHLTDSLNSNIQPHTATTSKHQTIIVEVNSSRVMDSYSIDPSSAMVEIVSSGKQMDDQSTPVTDGLMITAQPSITSEISDLQYASSAVTNPYMTSKDESPVDATPSFLVGHVTSTDKQMDDESTDGMSDIMITAQPSITSEISDLEYAPSSATNPYITSTDESPVDATPSFLVGHVTSTDKPMDDESTDGMSDIMITAQPSLTSEISDLQYAPSSVTNTYMTSKDESSVAEMSFSATPSIPDVYVTSKLSDGSYVLVTDSFGGNLLESLDSPLETPSLVIDGSVTDSFNYFTSEMEVSSINPSSSTTVMPTSIPIPRPDVKATGETVYQDQGNLTFTCKVDNYHNFTSIILEFDDVVKLNITEDIEDSEWSLIQTKVGDTLTLAATYHNPTCEDSNKLFRCSVYGDWGVVDDSASSVVKVKPGTPDINLPIKFIENEHTVGDIYCSVDRGIPAATVSWSVEFVDGRTEDPYDFSAVTSTNSNQTCTHIVKSSIRRKFDLSWHNSSLCCTATQDQITTSTCKKLYILPADYCMGKEDKLYDHPYDDCYLFVQCSSNKTYINTCGEALGLCFNGNTETCSNAIATTTDPNFIDDPFSCEGKPNYAYIPVKGSCQNYTRCVHGKETPQVCPGDTYFRGTPKYEYTCVDETKEDYCTSIPIPKPDVKATGETVYQDQGNLTFTCKVDNYHNFTSIILEFDDVVKLNITEDIEDSEWSLIQTKVGDTLTLAATYHNPTCEDSNKLFRCSVYGDWGVVDDSASSVVKVKPGTPDINLPIKFIENEENLGDIYCSVDRGIPAATVSWSVEFVDGRTEDPYDFSAVTSTNSNQTCTHIVKSSIRRKFDLSWHNSSLCCTATQDQITTSTCKKLYILPADYCMGKEDKLYDHPYDDCYLFVQCSSNKTYINTCEEALGLCFNGNTESCSDAIATTTDPNFIDDPFSCEGKPNYAYIPVKGSCQNYTRCVHGKETLQVCPGHTYFRGTPKYEYTCVDETKEDYCTSIPIPKKDVKATGETVYQDQGNLTFTCKVDNYHNFTSIILEFDDVVKFNITKDNDGIEDSEWSLVQKTLEDTLTLAATYKNPTCEDSNKIFRCSVYGDWGVVDDSASSDVKVKPGTPDINLPIKFIENEHTVGDIYCSVDRGIPAATVSWSVEFIDGRTEDPYDFTAVTTTTNHQTCSYIVKSSIRRIFDLRWHNSSLCCTATQDQITTSTCKKLYILPADYCMGKEDKLYDHPYDDCYLFVQCSSNKTYINTCGEALGLCFNGNTETCSNAIATTTDPNFIDDPFSCEGKPNYAYIPVKGSCQNYTRCVHGKETLQVCPGDTYFRGTPKYEYTCVDETKEDYCKRNGTQSTE